MRLGFRRLDSPGLDLKLMKVKRPLSRVASSRIINSAPPQWTAVECKPHGCGVVRQLLTLAFDFLPQFLHLVGKLTHLFGQARNSLD